MNKLYKNIICLIVLFICYSLSSFGQTITVTNLTNGIANPATLSAGQVDVPIIGFAVKKSGAATNFTAINIPVTSTPIGKFINYRLYRSTDNDAASTADNVLIAGVTITPTAGQIQITGLAEVLGNSNTNYFLEVDIDPSVTAAAASLKPSITQANVTVSAGAVNAFTINGQTYTFYAFCTGGVPTHVVDLTGQPSGVYLSPSESRAGICCGLNPNPPDNLGCVEFLLTLDAGAQGIRFDIASGAAPSGSLGWSLNCGPEQPVGQDICLSGIGPHKITFCKPGNNPNSYKITSIPAPKVGSPSIVSSACNSTITATGYNPASITWKSISPGAVGAHNAYLSCTSGCLSTTATYQAGAPDSVDYQICGTALGGCSGAPICKTTRVYFVNDKTATIIPANPTICFGGVNTTITAVGGGGKPPYTYLWNTGATTASISVGAGNFSVVITDASSCPSASASVTVTANASPITANAGPDDTSCVNNPNVTLRGTVVQATGGVWTGGAGTYTVVPSAYPNVVATYAPSAGEKVAGTTIVHTLTTTGNGTCPPVSDTQTQLIVATPIVNAGGNKTVCANNASVAITGTVLNATGGLWTTSGSGSFFPNATSLVMTYTPSPADTTAKSVTLTLTSTGNGTCTAVANTMVLTITQGPSVKFTAPTTVCANNATIGLVGSVTKASGGTWTSSGAGGFSPNANTLTATYTPTAADKTAGTVTLTLTTAGMTTNCTPISVSKVVSITPAPTSTPGPNQSVCANKDTVTLAGSVTQATGGIWSSSGTGSFTPNTSLSTTYIPSASDISVGTITLTLTTTGNSSNCNAVATPMTLTITPKPTVNAGAPAPVCGNNSAITLAGAFTVATGATWSVGAGAFSPNQNTMNATYTPTAAEITAGVVNLRLTTTGNNNCNAVISNTSVTITPAPTVTIGPAVSVCANKASVNLTATLTVATGVAFTSNGTGVFSSVTPTTATYTPSGTDITNGTVTITATTNAGNGNCTAVVATKVITITPAATVSIASVNSVCANNAAISLTGSITLPATGATWSSNGTGTFNNATLTPIYTPSAADKATGSVMFTLTTTGSSPSCVEVNTTKTVTITPAPTVSVGPTVSVCANNATVNITATLTVATGVIWTSNGTGTFGNANALSTTYTPSAADKTATTVTLTATTNAGNGTCNPVAATKVINITVAPTVSIASVNTVCANNATISLTGTITAPATGATWASNGSGTFNNGTLTPTYTPSAADKATGSVMFTLTTTGSSPSCIEVNTTKTVTITPAPTVNQGPDQTVCANNSLVTLSASETVATGVLWSSNGTGTFSSTTALNPTYTPSAADKAAAGPIVLTITTTGNGSNCIAVSGTLALTITPSPTANAGPNKTVCSNNASVAINGSVTVATGGTWTTSGNGTFTPSANALVVTYNPGPADFIVGIADLFLTTTGNGTCFAGKDTVRVSIFNAPVISNMNNQSICKNNAASVSLSPAVSNAPTTVLWSTNGTGTFGNANAVVTTYLPSAADIASGAVTLTLTANKNLGAATCTAVSSSLVITFTTSPTVNAGGDQTVCANNAVTTLAGSMTIATASLWSTNGTGTFASATSLNTTYTPSPADTVLHSVILTLTTTSQGNCTAVSDAMTLTISSKPTSIPGVPQTVCANNASVTLAGGVRVATGGTWSSGGTGTFSPNVNTLNATYLPSAADTTAGTVTLTLTTSGNGNCLAVSKPLTITITKAPTANAGVNRSICANNPTLTLAGSVTVATGGTWTGGLGTFSNANSLTSTYTATAAEIAATTVTLTLVTTGMGTCNAVQDQMIITITPAPTVNAGSDQTICSTSPNAPLSGSVTVATGGTWTSNGTGTFSPNANTLSASYVPSAGDKTAGNITLTLTTTGIGNCIAVVDQMVITITANPTSSAGPNQTVCTNNYPVILAGTGSPSVWTTGGTGTFSPSSNILNASYTPSSADSTIGSVILTLHPNSLPGCPTPATTSVTITIPAGPVVNAGPDVTVCGDVNSVALAASVTNAAGGSWTSNGTGTFSPNANTVLASYIPSAGDKTAGSVTLTLTSTGSAPCTPEVDQMILTITPAPTISAGPDLIRCADVASVPVTGTKNAVVSSITWTRVGGGGTFSSTTALSMNYTPSIADTTAHSVKLVITSGGTGTCATVRDTMTIAFTPAPVVSAGSAQTVCADTSFIILNGSVTVATGGTWSGGSGGVYSPNNTSLNTSYFPTAADTAAGFINFTMTSSGNGTCNAVSKTVAVTINHAPVVNAGPDKVVCADVTGVLLNGAFVNNAGGGTWTSTGTGTFSPNPNTVLATYNFSAADKTGGTVTLTLKSTGNGSCKQKSDQVILTITTAPTVNAGPSRTICADANTVSLSGSVTVATGGTWTTSGTGTFSPNANTLIATYNVSALDKTSGPITLTLTTTGNGTCTPVTSTMTITITPTPIVNAGPAQTICADAAGATLNGTVSAAATGGAWTSTGTGTFSPNATTLNATYVPSAAERATAVNIVRTLTLTSTGNGTCNPVTSNMTLTITPAPTVNAGANVSVCGNNAAVALNGTMTVATGGLWTTNGTGTFGNANALSTSYTPSPADISNGSVDLTLTTVGNGTCNAVSSTKIVAITAAPVVNAGANRSVCANNPTVALIGSITAPATGGTWTSTGTGTFSPNVNTLVVTYTPSAADILAGTATLTLTSTGNANCNPVSSNVIVTITSSPTVNPGAAQTVCANNATIALNGIVTIASGGDWTSTGTGTFTPNASTLIATYTPSAADTTAHGVTLTLTSTGNGTCNAVSATKAITITSAPVIKAGPDQTICADLAAVTLNGSRTVATGSTWTSSGSGTFANATLLNTTYTPSATDKTNGAVNLTLTPNGFGTCAMVTDQMIITITPAPTVNAGPDQTICADVNSIVISGSKTVATGVTWSSTGTGVFSPGTTSLNGFYTPSAFDKANSPITITLATTGNGTCTPVTSQFVLTITPAPTVDAGPDQTVCADIAGITLNGSKTVASGATWTSTGTGTFAPNSATLNATYTPSAAEKTAGVANLTLTTNGSGTCIEVADQMKITITPAPTVNAGPDLNMCADNGSIVVNGSVTVATGGTWTTASGTGTFSPDPNTLLMTFTPSPLQITQGFARLTLTTTGNGTCIPVTDQMQINIAPVPVVTAGPNQNVCADLVDVTLAGSVTNAGGGTWTTSGTGIFLPNANTVAASYRPSAADKIAATITLTLTSTGNGKCNAYSSSMALRITPVPTVDAGPANICSNAATIALNGTVTNAAGGKWTTSSVSIPAGTFSPSSNVLTTSYVPTPGDVAAGGVTLTLTTTGTGACAAVSDNINLVLQAPPTANAGPDKVVCANNDAVALTGVVGGVATTGTWTSTGGGAFSPNANTLIATYTPSGIDIVNGTTTLTLTTTGVGVCNPASDQMKVTITPGPTVNAGVDQTICADNAGVTLNGSVTVATGGTWTSNGTGTFLPNANTLNATYKPSAADTTAHSVTLTLTTSPDPLCSQITDQMIITITPAPTVLSGPDYIICADAGGVGLSGKVTAATGGIWNTTGSGTFANINDVNTLYNFSAGDRTTGSVKLILTTTGNGTCNAVRDTMAITIPPAPIVTASATNSCSNAASIPLTGSVTNAGGGIWSSNSALGGTFAPSNTTINASYVKGAGETSVILTLTSTGNGTCNAVASSFTLSIQPAPTANANVDQTKCKNNNAVTLNGIIGGGSVTGIWSTTGSGTFAPANTTLNGTYTPSAADLAADTVYLILTSTANGLCSAAKDTMRVNFTPTPTVDAGPAVVCTQNPTLALNGIFTVAPGIQWTTTGTGSFTPDNITPNATYTFSAADILLPSINITLSATGIGTCNAVSDVMLVNIANSPSANGGGPKTVCANNRNVSLNGSTLVSSTGAWSTLGSGTFSQASNILVNTYVPSDADTTNGTVKLVLTTTSNGVCSAVSDTVVVTITDAPTINLGPSTVCSNNPPLVLNATFTVASGGTWSSSSGGAFAAPASNPSNSYTPTAGDIGTGQVTLTFTTNPTAAPGSCVAAQKSVILFITGAPTANAGLDKIVCADTSAIPLNGTISGATGGVWSKVGAASGTLSPLTGVNPATYFPSAADTAAGSVKLVLTTTGNGSCIAHTDTLKITITDKPTINAGPDQIICADRSSINLNGLVTTAGGGSWTSSSGLGTFGNSALLATTYSPNAPASPVNQAFNLILTSTGNGNCRAVKDTVVLTITPAPTVNATPATICTDDAAATLTGVITVASGGVWTSSTVLPANKGIFAPNANSLLTSYIASAFERAAGSVTLYLTTTGNGTCNAVRDSIRWNIVPTPTANAGNDQSICAAAGTINLAGSVVTATGGTWSVVDNTNTLGKGVYNPNANTLITTYNLTSPDTAAHVLTFVLTTTGNNGCISATDSMTIFMTPAPRAIVNAGLDQIICADVNSVTLNGNVQNASGAAWVTNGNGIFTPSPFVLNAKYLPDAVDKASATPIQLILTSIGNGICNPVTDTMLVTITPAPTVTVNPDRTICADVPTISLTAVPTVATDGVWSTSGSNTFTTNGKNATYNPTALDISDSTLVFTFTTTTGNGTCTPATASTKVFITPAPTVNAGPDQIVCADNNNVIISGLMTVDTVGVWTTNGDGTFANANKRSTTYVPGTNDLTTGSIKLTLTSVPAGTCNPVADFLMLTITSGPTADAGLPQTICADAAGVTLAGIVTIASGGAWTSAGSGAFFPNNTVLTGTYIPSAADTAAHTVTLTLTTTGNGTCNAVDSTVIITITPQPVVNAGPDQTTCKDAANLPLSGKILTATGGLWTTSGSGSFTPTPNTLNASYTPSTADTTGGLVVLTLTSTTGNLTCTPVKDQMKIFLNPTPTANAGPNVTVCADADSVILKGSVKLATGGSWSIVPTFGSGVISNTNNLNTAYKLSATDKTNGLVKIVLTTTGNNGCIPKTDTMNINITPAPTVDAGLPQPICADANGVTLNGSESVATGASWTSSGSGVFAPNNDVLTPFYTPSAADRTAGLVTLYLTTTGNGTCRAVMDSVKITITPAPTVNAGPDQSVCGNKATVTVSGSKTVATTVVWSTSGTGTFGPANSLATNLNSTYTPSAADVTAGGVTLTLTTTAQGTCSSVFDRMIVTITKAPVALPGSSQTVCGNNPNVKLNGSVTVASGGLWSSKGTGTFSPNDSTLVTTYIASAADTAAGSVLLKLTTTGNSNCNATVDSVLITISNSPVVAIAAIPSICADAASVPLNGSVAVATGGTWTSTGTGIFALNTSDLTGSYFPSAADKTAGTIGLTLTTTGNGNCLSVVANRSFTITKKPVVSAGLDKTICADASSVFVTGTVTPGGGVAGPGAGTWSTSGTGTFGPANSLVNNLNTNYIPSAADIAGGTVNLTLTSSTNGTCNPVTDIMSVLITKAPTANAGPDKTICADALSFGLNGSVTVATGGTWTTTGTGSFTPNANTLNAGYNPSAADTASHSVILTLTTTGNGTCNAVNDPMTLTIPPAPVVSTGGGNVCAGVTGLSLNGSVLNAGGGQWTSSGTGVFSPNAFTLAVSYTPSVADITAGFAVLTLTSTGNGTCVPVSSSANVIIIPLPVSDAGPDRRICRGSTIGLLPNTQNVNNSYKWFTTTGVLISGNMLANVTANTDTAFVLMAKDQKGCFTTDTLDVFVVDPPTFSLANHFCLVNGLVINSNPNPVAPAGGGIFQWFENNNPIFGENNPQALAVGTVGTYIIEYKFGTCAVYDTTIVTLPPQLYSPDTLACINQLLTIKTTNIPGATYTWSTPNPLLIIGATNTFSVNVKATSVPNDSTDFVARVTDNVGCVSLDTVEVKTVPLPGLVLPSDTVACSGDTVMLVGKPSNINNTLSRYTWFRNGINLNVPDTTSRLFAATTGKYQLTYGVGGCSAKDSTNLVINPIPALKVSDIVFCFDNGAFTDIDAGAGFATYNWHSKAIPDSLAGRPDKSNQKFTIYAPGKYYVTVTNTFGCKTEGNIFAQSICRPDLNPPTGFFPSNDVPAECDVPNPPPGRCQDLYYRPYGNFRHATSVQFTIFNRWGEIIFYTEDPSQGWNGKYRGELMETGTYPWTLYYEGLNEEFRGPYKKSGSVTIIK